MRVRTLKHTVAVVLIALMPLFVAACGGAGGSGSSVAPYTIAGKVSLNGAGLPQVAVVIASGADSTTVYSSGNGSFTDNGLANGTYTVTPSLPGYSFTPASRTVTIRDNGQAVTFTATANPTYALSGHVVSGSGAGVAGVTVTVTDQTSGGSPATATTDGSGSYRVAGLAPGSYQVAVADLDNDSFTPQSQDVVITNADAVVPEVTAPALATYAIAGKVTTTANAGLAGVTLVLTSMTGATYDTVTAQDGSFTLGGIPDGKYSLVFSRTGYDFPQAVVTVADADVTGTNVTAYPQGSGSGGVTINF